MTDSSSKIFFPSLDRCGLMFYLNSPSYLLFKNIYFYGSIMCIFQVLKENVHDGKKKSDSEIVRDKGK